MMMLFHYRYRYRRQADSVVSTATLCTRDLELEIKLALVVVGREDIINRLHFTGTWMHIRGKQVAALYQIVACAGKVKQTSNTYWWAKFPGG